MKSGDSRSNDGVFCVSVCPGGHIPFAMPVTCRFPSVLRSPYGTWPPSPRFGPRSVALPHSLLLSYWYTAHEEPRLGRAPNPWPGVGLGSPCVSERIGVPCRACLFHQEGGERGGGGSTVAVCWTPTNRTVVVCPGTALCNAPVMAALPTVITAPPASYSSPVRPTHRSASYSSPVLFSHALCCTPLLCSP